MGTLTVSDTVHLITLKSWLHHCVVMIRSRSESRHLHRLGRWRRHRHPAELRGAGIDLASTARFCLAVQFDCRGATDDSFRAI